MFKTKNLSLAIATICSLGVTSVMAESKQQHHIQQGQFDLVIADEERLIDMLKKSGRIDKNAGHQQAIIALHSYLQKRAKDEREKAAKQAKTDIPLKTRKAQSLSALAKAKGRHNALQRGNGNKNGFNFKNEEFKGAVRTDRILAILMDFPDFRHNDNTAEDTNMYYENYSQDHFQQLLFSKTGFAGPDGQNFISMKQYYEAQSGGSYSVEGNVAGWYTAQQDAAYYGNNENGNARALIQEALAKAAQDPKIDLSWYDIEDRYDLDGDGITDEPDGLVDHIMVFHGSVGEEAGGGQLGEDAIWAHRWNLGALFEIPGSSMAAYDYTIQPISSAAGVTSHEFGHDLGLPDEYDTASSGEGEPVSYWSVMSGGSWAGKIGGSEPTGFSAWAKEQLQGRMGGNWLKGETIELEDVGSGIFALLDQASGKGRNNDAVRINLPAKVIDVTTPTSGEYSYFGGKDVELTNKMSYQFDLTDAASATLKFQAWYDIENEWDYGYVMVNGITVAGNITQDITPNGGQGHGITGSSDGWVESEFDLSAFAGQQVTVSIEYYTDSYVTNAGLYVDDIQFLVNGAAVASDDAESESIFALEGFSKNLGYSDGKPHYYLLEWRTHHGVDMGLKNLFSWGQHTPFNEGLLIWYVDENFTNNHVGIHPGDGFLGVVDADQSPMLWNGDFAAGTRYQIHDATFRIKTQPDYFIEYPYAPFVLEDINVEAISVFDDSQDYTNQAIPDAGRKISSYGLKIEVLRQSNDGSVGLVKISR